MADTRAKFRCSEITHRPKHNGTDETIRTTKFQAVTDEGIPENQRYHTATPSGSIEITVDNPLVDFVPGRSYYVDFTAAE
jgi:hypothetical protein